MAEQLRIDVEALRQAGNQVAGHGEALDLLHRSCHGEARDAHPGWVGCSAAALTELLEAWEESSIAQLLRVGGQSCELQAAAAELLLMESRNAALLSAADTSGHRSSHRPVDN